MNSSISYEEPCSAWCQPGQIRSKSAGMYIDGFRRVPSFLNFIVHAWL